MPLKASKAVVAHGNSPRSLMRSKIGANLGTKKTSKPVLLADAAGVRFKSEGFFKPNNGTWYADTLNALFENPGCIGFHLCGAYQRNKSRRRGLLDEMENPDQEHVDMMTTANQKIAEKVANNF